MEQEHYLEDLFSFFNQTGTESFNNDLNGLLSSNNVPPFQGTWVIKGAAYTDQANSTGTTCHFTVDSLIVVLMNWFQIVNLVICKRLVKKRFVMVINLF